MTRPLRLWVIDPSLHRAEEQGVETALRDWTGTTRVFRPGLELRDGPTPETGYETDGVVLMGSAASVHDPLDWMERLSAWLLPLLNGKPRIPVLGICFGHQLIAHLARGRVGDVHADRSKLLGVERTRIGGSRLLPGTHTLEVVVSHREEVKTVPPGYRVTARRERSPVDGLEHGTLPVHSFQFHPEAREEFARHAGIAESRIDSRVREDGDRVLAAFRESVRRATPR
jgi:GMP synthase (glutamine-hydrolysing)